MNFRDLASGALGWATERNPRYDPGVPEESFTSMAGRTSQALTGYDPTKEPSEENVPSDAARLGRYLQGKENPPLEPQIAIMPGTPKRIAPQTLARAARLEKIYSELKPREQALKGYEVGTDLKRAIGEKPGEAVWYQSARNLMDMFDTPQDWNQFLRYYAATSPQQAAASGNVDAALKAFKIWKTAKNPTSQMKRQFMAGHSGNLVTSTLDPAAEMSGPKVSQFNRALPSLREGMEKGDPEAMTFDRHMLSWYTTPEVMARDYPKGTVPDSAIAAYVRRGIEDARYVGTTPQEFQETVWRGYIKMKYGPEYPGIKPSETLVRERLGERNITNISQWAKKVGTSVPLALFFIGKMEGGE